MSDREAVGTMGALRAGHGDVQSGVPFVALAVEAPGRKMSEATAYAAAERGCQEFGATLAIATPNAPVRRKSPLDVLAEGKADAR